MTPWSAAAESYQSSILWSAFNQRSIARVTFSYSASVWRISRRRASRAARLLVSLANC